MTAHRSMIRRAAAVAAAATAAVLLAACGGGDDSSSGHGGHAPSAPGTAASASARDGEHNAADVAFAQGMIPHHRQAVEMADLAATRAGSADVKALAAEIKKAQDPEIKTLSGWLTSWGEDVPKEDESGEHAGHSMSGMMTPQEMAELEKASGEAFDTAFLEMMVKHHEGAVDMARTEQADGSYRAAKDMAGDIVTSQSAEITRMNELLGKN
ncbi:lipoprotein [Streptomyces kurssanovii]|nr:lipoprotein [Streptomyces kurssanovii]